jgi:hypothetical protein
VIETESSTSDSDANMMEPFKLLENKDPMIKLILLGKIKRIFDCFVQAKIPLTQTDRNLLRGIYTHKLKDFTNDCKDVLSKMPLHERLRQNMFKRRDSSISSMNQPPSWAGPMLYP